MTSHDITIQLHVMTPYDITSQYTCRCTYIQESHDNTESHDHTVSHVVHIMLQQYCTLHMHMDIHIPSDSLTLSCFCSLVVVDTLREVDAGEGMEEVMVEEGER